MAPIRGNNKKQQMKAKTPDARSQTQQQKKKTPKSAPQVKRKKLDAEIDEELSDLDFDEVLLGVKGTENDKKKKKNGLSSMAVHEVDESDEAEISDEDDIDSDEEEEEDSDEGESDDEEGAIDMDELESVDEDDEDDDDEEDDEEGEDKETDDEEEEEEDDDDSDDGEEADDSTKQNLMQLFEGSDEESDEDDEDQGVKVDKVIKQTIKEKVKKRKADAHPDAPNTKKNNSGLTEVDAEKAEKARVDRDLRSLFVKNLPTDIKVSQLQALSADILNVRLRMSNKKSSKNKGYAFLEFKNEKMADKNYPLLNSKKIGDCEVVVDFVGTKSKKSNQKTAVVSPSELDPVKLYVNGFGQSTTMQDLKKVFPTAKNIDLPLKKKTSHLLGFAFVHFADPDACKKSLSAASNKNVCGSTISVSYAKLAKPAKQKKPKKEKKAKQGKGQSKTKSATKVVVEQEDESGSDEQDDDEDDDDIMVDLEKDSDDSDDDDDDDSSE